MKKSIALACTPGEWDGGGDKSLLSVLSFLYSRSYFVNAYWKRLLFLRNKLSRVNIAFKVYISVVSFLYV